MEENDLLKGKYIPPRLTEEQIREALESDLKWTEFWRSQGIDDYWIADMMYSF